MQTSFFSEPALTAKVNESGMLQLMSSALKNFKHEIYHDETLNEDVFKLHLSRANTGTKLVSNIEYTGPLNVVYKENHRLLDGYEDLILKFYEVDGKMTSQVYLRKNGAFIANTRTRLIRIVLDIILGVVALLEYPENRVRESAYLISYYLINMCGIVVKGQSTHSLLYKNGIYTETLMRKIFLELTLVDTLLKRFKEESIYAAITTANPHLPDETIRSYITYLKGLTIELKEVEKAMKAKLPEPKVNILAELFKKFGK